MSSSTFLKDRFVDREPTIALAEVTRSRLDDFRQRRLLLWLGSGLGWTLLALVVVLLLGMLIDALWTNPAANIPGSIAVYTIIAVVGLRCWGVVRRRQGDLRDEARRLERLDPRLRERLLSAVELSVSSPQIIDSPAFRSQLQQQVARLIDAVDMRQLLPWQNIKRPVSIGLGACAALLLLCLIPSLYIPNRMSRILLPMFDWGRVGRFVISLERPKPHSKTVPRDDIVAITARTIGPPPSSLQLQTRSADGKLSTRDMPSLGASIQYDKSNRPAPNALFEALLPIDVAQIEYRIFGDGSSTPWYRLTSVPRPTVTQFEKQISPPAYNNNAAQTPVTTVVESHGNLRVLRGSRVKLLLTIDQPVSLAELRWFSTPSSAPPNENNSTASASSANESRPHNSLDPLPLQTVAGSQRRFVELLAERSASYKIHLQSLEGGITNEYSPTYELQVVDDRAPVVRWLQPRDPSLIATAEQILTLQHEIVDELPLATVTRSVRVNGSGDWHVVTNLPQATEPTSEFSLEPPTSSAALPSRETSRAASQTGDLLQRTSRTRWELDLLSQRAKPGDYLEVKLSATDLSGLVGESSILRINISSTSLALEAQAPELGRRDVAKRLAAVANKFAEAKQVVQNSLTTPLASSDLQSSIERVAVAQRVAGELRAEIAQTIAAIEQAATEAGDVLSSQALSRSGEILAALRTTTAESWEENISQFAAIDGHNREQKLNETRQKLEEESNQATELARQFEAISTYDTLSRLGRQIARLADAEQQLNLAVNDGTQTQEQIKRRQLVLAQQLQTVQQAMFESLPLLRQDSRQPIQASAQQLGQQIEAIERFDDYDDRQAMQQMTGSIAEQLARLQLLSQLDGSLSNAVRIAERRLAEMSPSTSAPLHELADQLASDPPADKQLVDAQTEFGLSQLSTRRDLQRAAVEGDRQYAADIGNAQRALSKLRADTSLGDQQQSESIRKIAGAMDTLQAIHHVGQLQQLMHELLQNERWDDIPGELASHAPRVWDALESRYEQATHTLRAAQIPDEILQSLNEARWGPAAQRAGQRLSHRLWDPEKPQSAAADVELLMEQLTSANEELIDHAQQARLTLQQHAPAISLLAEQAAARVDDVEEQTMHLADAIERDEVPQVPISIDELQSQTNQLQPPLDSLREALVDQAESQDLLNLRQLQLARTADAAVELVDRVADKLNGSLDDSASRSPSPQTPSLLRSAAHQQGESAAALRKLAELYARELNDPDNVANSQAMAENAAAELTEQLPASPANELTPDGNSTSEQAYQRAQQLADLAQQDPRRVLEKLERELPHNPPMSDEMSKISQQTTRQALDQLELAAEQQQQLSVNVEQSDPNFRAQMQLMLHDVQGASSGAMKMLDTLVSEAKWTAEAGQNEAIGPRIERAEEALRASVDLARNLNIDVPFEEVQAVTTQMHESLAAAEQVLIAASEELSESVSDKIHDDQNQLIQRRREMLDRQRRIQQQTVRDAQQAEREEQERLQQLDNELRHVEQQVQQIAEQQQNDRRQLQQQPDQQWLQEQIAERQPQLEMARASQAATKILRAAVERRAEQARQQVEQMNSQSQSELKSDNPAAELSAQLSQQSAEASRALADKLSAWQSSKLAQPLASANELEEGKEREAEIGKVVEGVADDLLRAARHEARLERNAPSSQLSQAAAATQAVTNREIEQATQQFAESQTEARANGSKTRQASKAATQATLAKSESAQIAIEKAAQDLRGVMSNQEAKPQSSFSTPSPATAAKGAPLDDQQKARLLDELDRQLNSQQAAMGSDSQENLEAQTGSADTTEASPKSPSQQSSSTLAEAARRLSQSLSRARQPPQSPVQNSSSQANSKSRLSNLEPQFSSSARVVPVDRLGSDWGQLREQATDDLLEAGRDNLAPEYQKQIDAYFRELAEQARE